MTKKILEKTLMFLLTGSLIFGLMLTGCTIPASKNISQEKSIEENEIQFDESGLPSKSIAGSDSIFSYRYGQKKQITISDSFLESEYNKWKNTYLTNDGCPSDSLRVKRDEPSYYDTVSEGQAYGMLLAVYFNDKPTFYKLYKYVKAHLVDDDYDEEYLMHWKVKYDGTNIDEFRLNVEDPKHNKVYMEKSSYNEDNNGDGVLRDEDRVYIMGNNNNPDPDKYVRAAKFGRDKSSASDADFDMAAALIIAGYKWGSSNYLKEAAKMINAITLYDLREEPSDVAPTKVIRNGNKWGGQECWNPSYFSPAWFKLYIKFLEDYGSNSSINQYVDAAKAIDTFNYVIEENYKEMNKLYNNSGAILFPDWCDTTGSKMVRPDGESPSTSDRYYYFDENGEAKGPIANADDHVEGMQSFNFYYDAIRVCWRLAVDYSWYGDTRAYNITEKMRQFFKSKGSNLLDGYDIYGNSWKRDLRDGFNNLNEEDNGGQWRSVAFLSMCAAAFVPYSQSTGYSICKYVKDNDDYGELFNYYGNTLRLLSLLYISGKFVNPIKKVAIRSNEWNGYDGDYWHDSSSYIKSISSSANDNYEYFDLCYLWDDQVALRSYSQKKFLRSYNEKLRAYYTYPNSNRCRFYIKDEGSSRYSFKNVYYEQYICSDKNIDLNNPPVMVNRSAADIWEKFRIYNK